ncbi:hypothetical protein GQ54DRAFT_337608 [Martensiomyces pterosporus]|nr:hypothetical protein GQ54DRAFT_337608 [Martensiomyces pterosporus]
MSTASDDIKPKTPVAGAAHRQALRTGDLLMYYKKDISDQKEQQRPEEMSTPNTPDTASSPSGDSADEDDEVCAICLKGDFTPDNLIVFCEGKCKLGFHQKCYGINEIPPGDEPWYCDWCAGGNKATYGKNLYCCHYKNDKSARTLIIEGKPSEQHFVHVHCAAWIPDVDTSTIPFATKVSKLKAELTKCYFCDARFGYQVRCSHADSGAQCEMTFHPMCAVRYKFLAPPPTYNTKYSHHLCPLHAPSAAATKRRRVTDVHEEQESSKRANRRQSLPAHSSRASSTKALSANVDADAAMLPVKHSVSTTPAASKQIMAASATAPAPASKSAAGRHRGSGAERGNARSSPARSPALRRAGRLPTSIHDDLSEASSAENGNSNGRGRAHRRRRHQGSTDGSGNGNGNGNGDVGTDGDAEADVHSVVGGGARHTIKLRRTSSRASPSLDPDSTSAEHPPLRGPSPESSELGSKEPKKITLTFTGRSGVRHGSQPPEDRGTLSIPVVQREEQAEGGPSVNPDASRAQMVAGMPHQMPRRLSNPNRAPNQHSKRPTIRVKPFGHSSEPRPGASDSTAHKPGALYQPQSPGVKGFAVVDRTNSEDTAARLPEEQVMWIKQSHDMLMRQSEVLGKIQEMVSELSTHPARQAQHAMSTISSLTALISSSGGGGGTQTPKPQITPPLSSQNARLPEEQVMWIKQSHDMLMRQSEVLGKIQEMVSELSTHPARQAQHAMSTISSLTALISSSGGGGGGTQTPKPQITPPLSSQNGTTFAPSRPLHGGPDVPEGSNGTAATAAAAANSHGHQLPRPALSLNKLYSKGAQEKNSSTPAAVPKHAAASLSQHLPKAAALSALPKSLVAAAPTGDAGHLASTSSERSSVPPRAGAPQSAQAELDELKANVLSLIKLVNMPEVLKNMFAKRDESKADANGDSRGSNGGKKPSSIKTLIADLKQLGALSRENVCEYVKVFVRNLEAGESS